MEIVRGAKLSECGRYRFVLWRFWGDLGRFVDKGTGVCAVGHSRCLGFVGINPSTADGESEDATTRWLIDYCKKRDYDGYYMLNLMPVRSPSVDRSKEWLKGVREDGVSGALTMNRAALMSYSVLCDKIVAVWGIQGETVRVWLDQLRSRGDGYSVEAMFREMYCIDRNKDGSPAHPGKWFRMNIPGDTDTLGLVQRYRIPNYGPAVA